MPDPVGVHRRASPLHDYTGKVVLEVLRYSGYHGNTHRGKQQQQDVADKPADGIAAIIIYVHSEPVHHLSGDERVH